MAKYQWKSFDTHVLLKIIDTQLSVENRLIKLDIKHNDDIQPLTITLKQLLGVKWSQFWNFGRMPGQQ